MRCVLCALSVCLVLGCRNQQGSPTVNPFFTPDRVPPPVTRVLQPGTAQPYYSGDPVPSLPAAGFPAQNYQPAAIPLGSAYPPVQQQVPPTYQAPQPTNTPTTPPGGWNSYPSSGSSSRNNPPGRYIQPSSAELPSNATGVSQAVRIQADQQNLRFAPASTFAAAASLPVDPYFSRPNIQTPAQQPVQMPIQSILPPQQINPWVDTNGQPQYAPLSAAPRTQQVRIREVSPAELGYTNPIASSSTGLRTRDGFRPQGSFDNANRIALRNTPRSAVTPAGHVTQQNNAGRFGFDPNYQWLRGQIEYSQSTAQWKLRYIPIQGAASQGATSDPLGGSVVIENPHVLGNLQPGDFVQVRGSLRSQQPTNPASSPIYAITVVQRQRQ